MSFIKGELLEIIEFQDDSRDTLSWRFPDEDKSIKNGAQLIVRESQAAQFVYLGQFGDCFGPGKHSLVTDNIPVLNRLKGWKYGFESPFKADVYFINTRLFTGNKWGTANPVLYGPGELSGSNNSKPNTTAYIVEADWVPFGKDDSWGAPLANLKLGAQFIAYTRFNGGSSNYDGSGRNASANNTLYLFSWLVF